MSAEVLTSHSHPDHSDHCGTRSCLTLSPMCAFPCVCVCVCLSSTLDCNTQRTRGQSVLGANNHAYCRAGMETAPRPCRLTSGITLFLQAAQVVQGLEMRLRRPGWPGAEASRGPDARLLTLKVPLLLAARVGGHREAPARWFADVVVCHQ